MNTNTNTNTKAIEIKVGPVSAQMVGRLCALVDIEMMFYSHSEQEDKLYNVEWKSLGVLWPHEIQSEGFEVTMVGDPALLSAIAEELGK